MIDEKFIEALKVCRLAYRVGINLVPDATYNEQLAKLRELDPTNELLTRTTDDDLIDFELLARYNQQEVIARYKEIQVTQVQLITSELNQRLIQYQVKNRSKSIDTLDSDSKTTQWLSQFQLETLFTVSMKENGQNGKIYISGESGEILGLLSRGRDATPQVWSHILGDRTPPRVELAGLEITKPLISIGVEVCLAEPDLPELRMLTGKPCLLPHSTVPTLLTKEAAHLTQYLHIIAFDVDGINFETHEEMLIWLEASGFEIPPYKVVSRDEVLNAVTELGALQETYPMSTDATVARVNSAKLFSTYADSAGIYDGGIRALRIGAWKEDSVPAMIQNLYWDDSAVKHSFKARLIPVQMKDGKTVNDLQLNNPGLANALGLTIGSICAIKLASGATPILDPSGTRALQAAMSADTETAVEFREAQKKIREAYFGG